MSAKSLSKFDSIASENTCESKFGERIRDREVG